MTPTQITVAGKKVSIKGQAMTSIQGGMVKINAGGGGASQAKASLEKMAVEAKVGEFDGFGINKSVKPVQVASSGSNVPDDFGSGAIEPLFFPADMLGDFSPKNIIKNMAKKVFGKGDKSETDKGDDGIIGGGNTKTRLPRTDGKWDGKPGEGKWHSSLDEVNEVTGGKPVPFKNGRPDFSEWSKGEVTFKKGELNGTDADFSKVYKEIANEKGLKNKTAAKKLLKEKGLTPHHLDDKTIQLIPTKLHKKIPHVGSASDMRNIK